MGIINTDFTMPGQDMPPQNFRNLKTQQGQINWLAQFLMSVNNVFDNVSGSVTTLAEDQSAYVEIDFDDETNTATFDFYLPRGYRGYPGSMENVTATASTLAPGSSATVSVTLDQPTQSLAFSFGLPEGTPATDAQTASAVAAWIEAHPEAVTTVQDGAVSTVKLADGAVTFAKLASDVKAILAGKADLDDYAPLLTAGVAESVLSGNEESATFAVRESVGASVGVRALLGNTEVVSNDLVSVNIEGMLSTGFNLWNEIWEIGYINSSGNNADSNTCIRSKDYIPIIPNTVYYLMSTFTSSTASFVVRFYTANKTYISGGYALNSEFTAPSNAAFVRFYTSDAYGNTYNKPICINLSGSRNGEYLTYTYEQLRAIDVASHFPDGMRGAGTAHDELRKDKKITRIGAVDLGSLTWSYNSSTGLFYSSLSDGVKGKEADIHCSCATFTPVIGYTLSDGGINDTTLDKVCNVGSTYQNINSNLLVRDNDYSSTSEFKSAVSGVMLFYELATPTETEINPPINMDYLTQQGGTEQIVIPTGEQSVTPTFVYVQGYDANGITDKALGVIATVEDDTASTNYAIGSFFIYAGKLYKATSAIASGETITPGTNCTQTTVMAEILALS